MEHVVLALRRTDQFGLIYVGLLLFNFHILTLEYVYSGFLEQYVSIPIIGILVALASFLGMLVLMLMPILLSRFGMYRVLLSAIGVLGVAMLALIISDNIPTLLIAWAIHTMCIPILFLCFDILIEKTMTSEGHTGRVRSIALTISTLAALISPMVAGFLITYDETFRTLFIVGGIFLIPLFLLTFFAFRYFKDPQYHAASIGTLTKAFRNMPDVRNIELIQFLIRVYISWMIGYLPLHLHVAIGFSWSDIGMLLFIMFIPYLLLEIPIGIIADKWLGEKEMLITGIVITGTTTALLSIVTTDSFLVWGIAIFTTRVGMAFMNSMSEIYFFKKVTGADADILATFRIMRPLGYIVGLPIASVALLFLDSQYLWFILGIIMLLGIPFARSITDTR